MKHIRSTRAVPQIVPAHRIAVEAYGEAFIPDGAPTPDGFEAVGAPAPPTVAELRDRAHELGVEVPARASKKEIAAAIEEAEKAAGEQADTSDTPAHPAANEEE